MRKVYSRMAVLFVIICGCNQDETFVRGLDRFVSDVELNYKNFSNEEQIAKDREFIGIFEARFLVIRDKLTDTEISRENKLIGKYKALKIKRGIIDLNSELKDLFQQGTGVVKEMLPDSTHIKDIIERGKNEVKDL